MLSTAVDCWIRQAASGLLCAEGLAPDSEAAEKKEGKEAPKEIGKESKEEEQSKEDEKPKETKSTDRSASRKRKTREEELADSSI